MCGISGIAGFKDRVEAEQRVRRMMGSLERRGPDGEGIFEWNSAILGHRRLAIFDLSEAGRQPMLSPDKSLGVVFNGAIYNFRELRAELESNSYQFTTRTDTEVLLHGYHAWGMPGLVSRLRGMFAFGFWDERRRKLFLVRDRLGVKPLLYALRDGQIAFASTARALRDAGFSGDLDETAVAEFLEFGYVTDARAIYRGVSKVAAATILEWCDGNLKTNEYWEPPTVSDSIRSRPPSFDDAVAETEQLFLSAVEKRLFADVPVGALLSGGIDSGLVCWAIKRAGGDVAAYTVGTPGDAWDETEDATATARELGIRHKVLELSAADAPGVEELVSAYAEPFACASALGMLRVSRAVASEATVLLTGDGGDDVFLGYPEHRHLWYAERLARTLPAPASRLWLKMREGFPRTGMIGRAASFADYTAGGLGAVAAAHDGLPMYRQNGMLGERLAEVEIEQRAIPWSTDSAHHVLSDFLKHDRSGRFVGEYLTKVDGATMYSSLEARSPFLDQELWEFAASLPFDLRLRRGNLKAILRELARRHLGGRVAGGRKRGFSIPVQRWIAGRWRDRVEALLRDSLLEQEGWIHVEPTLAQLKRAELAGWAPKQLWYIYVLESWLRNEHKSQTRAESPSATFPNYPSSSSAALADLELRG